MQLVYSTAASKEKEESDDRLYIAQHFLKKVKTRKKKPSHGKGRRMMILQTWIIVCMKLLARSEEVVKFNTRVMESWRVEQKSNTKNDNINHHHHHVTLSARISLTLSCHPSLSSIASGIGTELFYVGSSWSSCLCSSMWGGPHEYVTYEYVPTCPACLIRLTWIVFVMDCKWPYSGCFVGCCLHDLFNIARNILL